MANKTKIEWTEYSWNFLRGCSRVSEGCRHCYAESIAARFSGEGMPYHGLAAWKNGEAKWTGEIVFDEDTLLKPLTWKKPRKIFVNSMSDLFHEKVKDEWLDKAFAVMALTPQHTYQILTKRPERMQEWFNEKWQPAPAQTYRFLGETIHVPAETVGENRRDQVSYLVDDLVTSHKLIELESDDAWTPEGNLKVLQFHWPLPNVWLGVSVEDQKTADERVPLLLDTPAAVRWISAEPLLGAIDLTRRIKIEGWEENYLTEKTKATTSESRVKEGTKLDWIVVGGESGHNARPMHPDWARSIRNQCKAAGVPFFFKQWGEWKIASEANGHFNSYMRTNGAMWVHNDGLINGPSWERKDGRKNSNPIGMIRVGKKKAGRLLDGNEWNEMPKVKEIGN